MIWIDLGGTPILGNIHMSNLENPRFTERTSTIWEGPIAYHTFVLRTTMIYGKLGRYRLQEKWMMCLIPERRLCFLLDQASSLQIAAGLWAIWRGATGCLKTATLMRTWLIQFPKPSGYEWIPQMGESPFSERGPSALTPTRLLYSRRFGADVPHEPTINILPLATMLRGRFEKFR